MRIHFTRADLAHTYLADGPDPLWELVNSLQLLQSRYGQSTFGLWRKQVAHELRRTKLAGPVRTRLFPLAPPAPYFPDLLTPPEAALGVEEGVETVLRTPRQRFRAEVGRLPGNGKSWLVDLANGRTKTLDELGKLLHAYHACAVAPYWDRLRLRVDSDVATRRQALRAGGVSRLLAGFQPMMRWREPVLELVNHPSDRDLHLHGRGLLLVPSYFCWCHPVTLNDASLPQVVVYPVEHDADWLPSAPNHPNDAAVARLLGPTRAAVLFATHGGNTTGDLAVLLRLSAATISHHTGVLRDAGLVYSRRHANTVLHTITPLGVRLLSHAENAE
jgi:DNA-binding transcriptional ArsR family regulator